MVNRNMNELIDYRRIASNYFKKEILLDEMVHHIDGNHNNNDPDNLVIMKKTQHSKVHVLFNFENWRRQSARVLCPDCLFCHLYDSNDKEKTMDLLYDVADGMLFNVKRTPHSMDMMYQVSKEWKERNKHDCYKHEHMEVVHV